MSRRLNNDLFDVLLLKYKLINLFYGVPENGMAKKLLLSRFNSEELAEFPFELQRFLSIFKKPNANRRRASKYF